jgi:glycosyltransferase involved in cell wall biosynthesis
VTVIMPVRNEARWIFKTLGAVLAQDYSSTRMEVLVVDGRSTDGTPVIVKELQARNANLMLLDNPKGIVSTGFNVALRQARGEFIIRVDGHTEIVPDYVRQCVAELERTGAANVGGRMAAVGTGPFGKAVAVATSSPFGVGGARFHYSGREEWVDTVYLGAWPRSVFDEIGLFDEEMVRDQDDEFNYRLRASGGRILLSPRIRSSYVVRSSLKLLFRQYFQYGYWKVRVLQKHPGQMRPRQFVPPLFVGGLIAATLGAPFLAAGQWALAGVACAYVAANLAFSVKESRRLEARARPGLPIAFAAMHLAYGLGFLAGLFRFWNRWETARRQVNNG